MAPMTWVIFDGLITSPHLNVQSQRSPSIDCIFFHFIHFSSRWEVLRKQQQNKWLYSVFKVLHYVILHCIILFYVVLLYYFILYYIILYYTILYYLILLFVGQKIIRYHQSLNWVWEDVLDIWWSEKKFYDAGNVPQMWFAHFTKMAWADTTKVGCAKTACHNTHVYAACFYNPRYVI